MNVLGYLGDIRAQGFYRMVIPLRNMEKQNLCNVLFRQIVFQEDITFSDVVVFQRQVDINVYNSVVKKIQCQGKVVIYEVDDFLHGILKSSPVYADMQPGTPTYTGMTHWLKHVDGVTVTREELRKRYLQYNDNIYVLPNFMDFAIWNKYKKIENKDKIIIGWAGSQTHYDDLIYCLDAVAQIVEKYPNVYFKMVGYCPENFKRRLGSKLIEGTTEEFLTFPKVLQDFDIGLAPLMDCPFNECKSNIKVLEYSCLGIPTVASPVGPYKDTIIHGHNGLIAKKNKFSAWTKCIESLIEDERYRKKMGQDAREFVKEYFDIKYNAWRWRDAYDHIRVNVSKKRKIFLIGKNNASL
jgi:glycosyltransferase involved in cell wall biosynthesis